MARLEHIHHVDHRCEVIDGEAVYTQIHNACAIERLPQIFWRNQEPWQEANLWACERARSRDVDLQTVETNLRGVAHYASFLESKEMHWFEFPAAKADRCLVQYRGFLKEAMKNGDLSPSTASARMRYVIAFYRWVQIEGLFKPESQLWRDIPVHIKYFDSVGFERTMLRITTDLSIPNRTRPGERLEDGLLPVSALDRDAILRFARDHASEELFLLLSAGFFTGMRLGTLCDLKIKSLEHAVPDPAIPGMFHLAVGPGASTPVATKFGVTGQVWITRELLDFLKEYAYSPRRLQREAKAAQKHRNLLFLTRFGNPYSRNGSDKSSAINVEMTGFRRAGTAHGMQVLRNFRFHQSRCTFGTALTTLAIKVGDNISAIAFVRDALLHKHEATTFKYIKFVEKTPAKEIFANDFTAAFLGVLNQNTRSSHA
ncbi:site-specific integrase [Collimonas sp.]|jgi:integrase|uniref:site-specific integrase n=1 Tax=Collimonas sp. TaxID=1963772 RepID=UPI002BAC2E79|nr:site-specific integrase [Collimonas sp.]HWW04172.1 site-specific integrase [Collimonas sp.]